MVFLKWLGRLILSSCAIAAAWGAWYVIYQNSLSTLEVKEKSSSKPLLAVEVMQAQREQVDEKIVLVGNLLPQAQTEIQSLVDGYIVDLPFDVGDRVQRGQTICQLDDSNHRDLLDQASARLEVAEAQLAVQISELKSSQRILDRELMLDEIGAGTQEDLENAVAAHEVALARKKLEESKVAEVKATYSGLAAQLKDFKLTSSISGYVSERMADIGDLAKSDSPIMQVVNLETVLTTVQIVEKDYQKISIGQTAIVSVDAYPDKTFRGEVIRVAPTLDQETRTASVQIHVANPESELKPGMYARVILSSNTSKAAVMIPLAAVLENDRQSFAYTLNDANQVVARNLRLGTSNGEVVEVLDGLQPGEPVVTLGNRLVSAGDTVTARLVSWSQLGLSSAEQIEYVDAENISVPLAGD